MVDELNEKHFTDFFGLVKRYYELFPDAKAEGKATTGYKLIAFSKQPIFELYDKYKTSSLSVAEFHQLMSEVDRVRASFMSMLETIMNEDSTIFGEKKTEDRDTMDHFVALRSLIVAHPLDTSRHDRFGFDGTLLYQGTAPMEEDLVGLLGGKDLTGADFVLCLRRVDELDLFRLVDPYEYKAINLEKQIFSVIVIILETFVKLNDWLLKKINTRVEELRNQKISSLSDTFNEQDFAVLFDATKMRYPKMFSLRSDGNLMWILDQLLEFIFF